MSAIGMLASATMKQSTASSSIAFRASTQRLVTCGSRCRLPVTSSSGTHQMAADTPRRNSDWNGGRASVTSFRKLSLTTKAQVASTISAMPRKLDTGVAMRLDEQRGNGRSPGPILHPFRPSGYGREAGAHHFDQPQRHHQRDETVDLAGLAGDFEDEAAGGGIHHLRPERIGEPQRLGPVLAGAGDLDQRQLALHRLALGG